jgi:DNA-binding PadR family transcriptional regulator
LLDLAVLGLLADADRHGYDLRKQLSELLGARGAMSFGSLYPALARLEQAGLVKAVTASVARPLPAPVPSSGSLAGELAALRGRRTAKAAAGERSARGGRERKVYGITDAGRARLVALLDEPAGDERTFAVQVAFCRHLDPDRRVALFQRRRSELTDRLAERARADDARGSRLDRYLHALRDHDTRALTNDLRWLDELLELEQATIPQEDTP